MATTILSNTGYGYVLCLRVAPSPILDYPVAFGAAKTKIKPANVQVDSPTLFAGLVAFCKESGITVASGSPLGPGANIDGWHPGAPDNWRKSNLSIDILRWTVQAIEDHVTRCAATRMAHLRRRHMSAIRRRCLTRGHSPQFNPQWLKRLRTRASRNRVSASFSDCQPISNSSQDNMYITQAGAMQMRKQ